MMLWMALAALISVLEQSMHGHDDSGYCLHGESA